MDPYLGEFACGWRGRERYDIGTGERYGVQGGGIGGQRDHCLMVTHIIRGGFPRLDLPIRQSPAQTQRNRLATVPGRQASSDNPLEPRIGIGALKWCHDNCGMET